MIRERETFGVNKVPDRLWTFSRDDLHSLRSEPVEPSVDDPANPSGSPEDEWKTPFRHPISEVRIFLDTTDVVMQSTDANVVEVAKCITARFELSKQSLFEKPFGMWQMIESHILRPHHYASPITHDRPRRALRVEPGRVPIAADQRR